MMISFKFRGGAFRLVGLGIATAVSMG